jgi:hypothetical protein
MNGFNAPISAKSNPLLLLRNAFHALTANLIEKSATPIWRHISQISIPINRIGTLWNCRAWLSKGRGAMTIADYVVIGVLVVIVVWAVADQFPRDKL